MVYMAPVMHVCAFYLIFSWLCLLYLAIIVYGCGLHFISFFDLCYNTCRIMNLCGLYVIFVEVLFPISGHNSICSWLNFLCESWLCFLYLALQCLFASILFYSRWCLIYLAQLVNVCGSSFFILFPVVLLDLALNEYAVVFFFGPMVYILGFIIFFRVVSIYLAYIMYICGLYLVAYLQFSLKYLSPMVCVCDIGLAIFGLTISGLILSFLHINTCCLFVHVL